ncbi:protein of unknown function [Shewanella benthica]|uniref:Uncharacterized protein n=1 Tax=Shewanella benthica TaxID=43661 RepID=A0A330M2M7_9GAMM|nr:hypothetical protein [Shewanella benthica]SQH76929.1 protein of unknown function [Shewanella benthica]
MKEHNHDQQTSNETKPEKKNMSWQFIKFLIKFGGWAWKILDFFFGEG